MFNVVCMRAYFKVLWQGSMAWLDGVDVAMSALFQGQAQVRLGYNSNMKADFANDYRMALLQVVQAGY